MLNFLGNKSGFGDKNNSAYIEDDGNLILIDCGFSVFNEIKNKFDFSKYSEINIIITHLHNDHAGSLSQVILYLWYIFNKKTTVISNCEHIRTYLDITGTPREAYELKRFAENIEFIPTFHVKELDSYGIKANFGGKKIIYTGDTSTLEPFIIHLDNVDELYVDVSKIGGVHLKLDEIIEKLEEIQGKGIEIYLMHLDDIEYIKNINKEKFHIAWFDII